MPITLNSPGQRPNGVIDLVLLVVGFGSRDVYIPPPFPVGPGAWKYSRQRCSDHFWGLIWSIFWGIDFRLIFWHDFSSILAPKMVPKWSQNRSKIWLFRRLALQVLFSCLNMLLKVIFASTSEPANLDFEATLWHFFMFFRFSEDRVENDFKVIFYLPKAQKNTQKSTKSCPKSSKKLASEKH